MKPKFCETTLKQLPAFEPELRFDYGLFAREIWPSFRTERVLTRMQVMQFSFESRDVGSGIQENYQKVIARENRE